MCQLIVPYVSILFNKGQEMEIDSVLFKISALVSLLSSLEKKVCLKLHKAIFLMITGFMDDNAVMSTNTMAHIF